MSSDSWTDCETVLLEFEEAWQSGASPSIEAFVKIASPDDAEYLLLEMCAIDCERRWQTGERPTVEEYVARFPLLGENATSLRELLEHEIAVRRANGIPVQQEELRQRFPQWVGEMESLLRRAPSSSDSVGKHPSLQLSAGLEIGNYRLEEQIGAGTFSVVYAAVDLKLHRRVAIKFLRSWAGDQEQLRERMLREARVVASLTNQHVVPVIEVGRLQNLDYIVSKLVEGPTLEGSLQHEQFNWRNAAALVRDLARACAEAHQLGIVHRDIKPANILMDKGRPLLTDFGLAHLNDATQELTHEGDIIGTPSYMAPEQASGQGWLADPRSDIYSLGVVLYRLVAKRLPFVGSTTEVLSQVIRATPASPRKWSPEVGRDLEAIALKCLEKEPADRYQTAELLADDLQRALDDVPVLAQRPKRLHRAMRWARRRPAAASATLGGLLLIAFLVGALMQLGRVLHERDRARGAETRAVLSEQKTQVLLASSAAAAGDLAMQRGQLQVAIEQFDRATQQGHPDPIAIRLKKVEALRASRQVTQALLEIESVHSLPEHELHLPEVLLRQADLCMEPELELAPPSEAFTRCVDLKDPAEIAYVAGMLATDTPNAVKHFEAAVAAAPYHHRARRMLIVTLLSLARFDAARQHLVTAHELSPDDPTYPVLSTLELTARGEITEAKRLVKKVAESPTEREIWIEFCDELADLRSNLEKRATTVDLELLAAFAANFEDRYQPFLRARGVHFPPVIAEQLSQFPRRLADRGNLIVPNQLQTLDRLKQEQIAEQIDDLTDLVKIHPEGTLLLLQGYLSMSRGDLDAAQKWFLQTLEYPSWLNQSEQSARINLLTVSLILAMIQKVDVEKNTALVVEAIRGLKPESFVSANELRGATIGLLHANELELAEQIVDLWVASPDAELRDALWHKAIVKDRQGEWLRVIECCDRILAANPDDQHAQNLRATAVEKIQSELKVRQDSNHSPPTP